MQLIALYGTNFGALVGNFIKVLDLWIISHIKNLELLHLTALHGLRQKHHHPVSYVSFIGKIKTAKLHSVQYSAN